MPIVEPRDRPARRARARVGAADRAGRARGLAGRRGRVRARGGRAAARRLGRRRGARGRRRGGRAERARSCFAGPARDASRVEWTLEDASRPARALVVERRLAAYVAGATRAALGARRLHGRCASARGACWPRRGPSASTTSSPRSPTRRAARSCARWRASPEPDRLAAGRRAAGHPPGGGQAPGRARSRGARAPRRDRARDALRS